MDGKSGDNTADGTVKDSDTPAGKDNKGRQSKTLVRLTAVLLLFIL